MLLWCEISPCPSETTLFPKPFLQFVTVALVFITVQKSDEHHYFVSTEVFIGQTVSVTPAQLCSWSLKVARDNISMKIMAGPAPRAV